MSITHKNNLENITLKHLVTHLYDQECRRKLNGCLMTQLQEESGGRVGESRVQEDALLRFP